MRYAWGQTSKVPIRVALLFILYSVTGWWKGCPDVRKVWAALTADLFIHVQYYRKHTDGQDYLPSVKCVFVS